VGTYLHGLNALNYGLSGCPRSFVDKISAAKLKDELTPWEVRTALGNRIAHFKSQAVAITILDDAKDPCAFKMDVGDVAAHAAQHIGQRPEPAATEGRISI
jgi:hypothetical protein